MYDIIVIGAGPAGTSAALFAAKARKKTLVLDHDKSITKMAWIENHYGAPNISGPDLIQTGKKQAADHGAEFVQDTAAEIEKTANGFKITTDQQTYEAQHVILATGMLVDFAEKAGVKIIDGTEPRVKSIVEVDQQGQTAIKGIWAAGTVAGQSVHTIITSGDGARVAINVISEMNGERYVDHDVLNKK